MAKYAYRRREFEAILPTVKLEQDDIQALDFAKSLNQKTEICYRLDCYLIELVVYVHA